MHEPNSLVERAVAERPGRLIDDYKKKHAIRDDWKITVDDVREHYYLERTLARSILDAAPSDRARAAEAAYTQFYEKCDWLVIGRLPRSTRDPANSRFLKLIPRGSSVYEVGSGSGDLAALLVENGRHCVATEISSSRGETAKRTSAGVEWHVSDGVHLSQYEQPGTFDFVVSNQVIEHIHPDDVVTHLREAWSLLRPGGSYILVTPHRFSGPHDVTALFGFEASDGFHLKEYNYSELADMALVAGFGTLAAVYAAPNAVRRYIDILFASSAYLSLLRKVETVLGKISPRRRRKVLALAQKAMLWRTDIFLVATKR